ncbi:Aste57867_18917 [Aphanomyces stellatus]|uniref:Aste57867_18917 protein n=1 Tax=Aphanomyces stellatus TaxID=120398 RepID=A0A485LBY4_9STRA|nr:hypothetical protein As57867_018853 [Aphanomyces stellatus]VFT95649.1 Aste57867_18917 [Aphanomyces stellatus]
MPIRLGTFEVVQHVPLYSFFTATAQLLNAIIFFQTMALDMPPPPPRRTTDAVVDEATAKRRLKERQKMQRYRQRLAAKASALRDQVAVLAREMQRLSQQRQTLLPWEVVADVMREESGLMMRTNVSLRMQCVDQAALVEAMKRWVVRVVTIPTTPSTGPTWRNSTLPALPDARKLGFDWITNYMYHNTDAIFDQLGYPHDHVNVFSDFSIDMTKPDDLQYVWRSQRDIHAPLEHVRDIFARPNLMGQLKGHYFGMATAPPDAALEALAAQDNLLLQPLAARYEHHRWSASTVMHFLAREFHAPGRCVFVAQNILDDECVVAPNKAERNRRIWLVLDAVTPSRTRMRALCLNSQAISKEGTIFSFENEALVWGCDVSLYPESIRMHKFSQHVKAIACCNGNSFGREVQDKLKCHQNA